MTMKQHGFTLLEAIVALVLLTSVGMALFSWLNAMTANLQRVEAALQRASAARTALGFLDTVNPMTQPEGETLLGEYRLTWRAKPIEPPKDSVGGYGGTVALYQVGLYEITAVVFHDETIMARFQRRQVGYLQVRENIGT